MPNYYDIYGFSEQRDRKTIETFLSYFSYIEDNENIEKQEIVVYKNEKYNTEETWTQITTLTEVIDFGLQNQNFGFSFYIGENLKQEINHIILTFTFDGKIIFGISVQKDRKANNGKLIDNYDKALEIEKIMVELTNSIKTSIQFEYPPSSDEEEFDRDIEIWRNFNKEKQNKE